MVIRPTHDTKQSCEKYPCLCRLWFVLPSVMPRKTRIPYCNKLLFCQMASQVAAHPRTLIVNVKDVTKMTRDVQGNCLIHEVTNL